VCFGAKVALIKDDVPGDVGQPDFAGSARGGMGGEGGFVEGQRRKE